MFLSGLFGASSRSLRQKTTSSKNRNPRQSSPSLSTSEESSSELPSQSQSHLQSYDSPQKSRYIVDESQIEPIAPLPHDILSLNNDLERLSSLFPDIQIEVFREMLSQLSDESKLFVITDMLLKNPHLYVKGRRRTVDQQTEQKSSIPKTEAFRTSEYKTAVQRLAFREFKGLSRSTINAVLSESNYSYLDARPTLVDISSKSWKFTFSSLILGRKPVTSSEAKTHPLISWRTSEDGSLVPSVRATGNAELDRELFDELILPLKTLEKDTREKTDRALALSLQTKEAEACEATYECACCYTDVVFEEMTTCSAEGHMVCFRCVQQSITEAVFGQGWQRSIHKDTGALRCPAVCSTFCEGCISSDHIRRAMDGTEKGAEIVEKLDQRLAEHCLLASGLPLIRCPFCNYAEVDELYMPANTRPPRFRLTGLPNATAIVLVVLFSPVSVLLLSAILISLFLALNGSFRLFVSQQFAAALSRSHRRRRGPRFVCQNPDCGRASCMSCSKAWVDIHLCHESSLIALRTQVEQAMSMAIKRVCPRCNTCFVKTEGCNKLTCPCGYKMCYVCRKDIGAPNEGYRHFCQHFRPEGDGRKCTQCDRCNLWETENTDAILRQAKADAERRWKKTERRELSNAEKAYLESGAGHGNGLSFAGREKGVLGSGLSGCRIPTLEEICDFVVDNFVA
ncbi:hypothetical protein F5B22DRAFT_587544 [Xylaria bambusicola]|uniref:uncharacterized protein n=1 Tax=Xylaria bambusicola TaxID=326684 RepID=UPI0020087AD6|nr:uncharacterized protein F5B22DRAFT_587544 [Xylaria bambusicola]KAI0525745.1 hypothetical protein F5B22DRAFT_587544 [Xylaria bambusicola]